VTIRSPSSAPPGPPGESPEEPRYPWQLFVGMLAAILAGGAVLGLLMGVNPLTFQKLAPARQTTPIAATAPPANTALALAPETAATKPQEAATPALAPATPAVAATTVPAGAPTSAATGPTTTSGALPQGTSAPVAPATAPDTNTGSTQVQAQVSPELASAILQAYNDYWSIRVRAMSDPANANIDLGSVMAGDELAIARKTLAEYRSGGDAFQTTVKHQIWLTRATVDEAEVVDQYTASTLKIDPATRFPVEPQPGVEQLTGRFVLQPLDGVWKVVAESYE
jgi:hypothetical protein